MQLSIVIPTNRRDLLACSRIAQACSWASADIEVVVRDNSGNADKRAMLSGFKRDNCNLVFAEPCSPMENYSQALALARGEFVFFVADDDFGFDRAIAMLPGMIAPAVGDASVAGITGGYALESAEGSSVVAYQNIDSDDVTTRVTGYLAFTAANVLVYSPIRKQLVKEIFDFMNGMPFSLSFHDQIVCLLYLLNGKFLRLKRLLYLYDIGDWEKAETAQKRDLAFYSASKLDPAINRLHWFLCGFEGAVLLRNAEVFPDYPMAQRQTMADRWFSTMFMRFRNNTREAFGSPLTAQADALCAKWKTSAGKLSFHDMLNDIRAFMALSSAENGDAYFKFWDAMINRRNPPKPG